MPHRMLRRVFPFLVFLSAACGGGDNGGGGNGPGNSLVVTPRALNLADCAQRNLTATRLDGDGNPVSGAQFSYSSTASSVATVSGTGVVTAAGVGTASIIVTSGQLKDTIPVTVTVGPLSVTASPDSMNLDPDGAQAISPVVLNCHGTVVVNPTVTYATRNQVVATVSNGLVIGEAPGLTGIIVTSGNGADTVPVNVYSPSHPGSNATTVTVPGGPFGVATAGNSLVYVTELFGGKIAHDTLPISSATVTEFAVGADPTDVAFTPRAMKAFVTNQASLNLGVIDPVTQAQVSTVPLGDNPFRVLAARNNRTYVTLAAGKVMVLNSTTNAKVDSFAVDHAPNGVVLSGDGNTLYVSSTSSGRILAINVTSGARADSITVGGTPQDIALSPDGLTLYVANEGTGVQQVDLASRTVTNTLVVPAFGMRLTPDGTQLIVASGGTVTVIDRAAFTAAPGIAVNGTARRVAFAQGGRVALIANEGGYVSVIQ